jgi:hypothetical protein
VSGIQHNTVGDALTAGSACGSGAGDGVSGVASASDGSSTLMTALSHELLLVPQVLELALGQS